jgi:hypothetical protein
VCNGRQPGSQLVEFSVDKSSAPAAMTGGPERRKLRNYNCVKSFVRERLVETVID